MPNSELIIVTGHISEPADIVKDGKTIGYKFGLAVGHGYKDKSGEWVDSGTTWYDVTTFGVGADTLREAGLRKGQAVRVQSRELQASAWIDKQGEARPRLTLKVWDGDVSVVQYGAKRMDENRAEGNTTGVPF